MEACVNHLTLEMQSAWLQRPLSAIQNFSSTILLAFGLSEMEDSAKIDESAKLSNILEDQSE